MKKLMTIAIVLTMVLAFGIVGINAQQSNTKAGGAMMTGAADARSGGMMMGTDCPMLAKTDGADCAMGTDGKRPMAADKCPMSSHHDSNGAAAHHHEAN